MLGRNSDDGDGMDPERRMKLQNELTSESNALSAAMQEAQAQSDQMLPSGDELLEELTDFDVDRDGEDDLARALSPHLSSSYLLSVMSEKDIRKFSIWTDSEAQLTVHKYPSRRSLATGTRGQIMYGDASPAQIAEAEAAGKDPEKHMSAKQPLSDDQESRIWGAADAKKAGLRLSKNGRLLSALTEIVAVSKSEKREREKQDKGRLSSLMDRLI